MSNQNAPLTRPLHPSSGADGRPDTVAAPIQLRNYPAYLAVALSLFLSILGLFWLVNSADNPLDNPDSSFGAALTLYPDGSANAIFFGCSLLALAGSLWLALRRPRNSGTGRQEPGIWIGGIAIVALLALMDASILMALGYLPFMVLGPALGFDQLGWDVYLSLPLVMQVVLLGTVAAIGKAIAIRLRARLAAGGARPGSDHSVLLDRAARRTKFWTKIAMEAPLMYALTRVLMFFCVPGFDFAPFGSPILWAGMGLALSASLGAWLTSGLIRPWGERFPRWMAGFAGRRVPIGLATVSGLIVAVMIAAASRTSVLQTFTVGAQGGLVETDWPLITLPMLLWPLWALALALASINYGIRRRLAENPPAPTNQKSLSGESA
ncbi:hypothetical protein LWF01_07610 [Saxibacter everestensis]|uniref:Uncharacterized protein n=1 Tax=Saxibacter everestensis TaxID=2909229 RepID=A0ABY8QXC6_9MICO|nr:hypothetical protein LWF01_07610 [Brevibacteriaceae bacterium ZFBP1038]